MTSEERIDWLCRLRSFLVQCGMPKEWRTKFDQALSDAIKQDGVLQEIRQEIAESKYNHRGEYNRELAFNICLQIIDNKLKEISNEN